MNTSCKVVTAIHLYAVTRLETAHAEGVQTYKTLNLSRALPNVSSTVCSKFLSMGFAHL